MFTGIVQGLGTIKAIDEGDGITTFSVLCPDTQDLAIGASVAIDGVCLTATSIEGELVTFDIIPETMERTTLGERGVGDEVNIERSQEAIDTGADEVAVACPFCYIMMDDGVKELGYGDNVKVRDVSLILLDNLKKD